MSPAELNVTNGVNKVLVVGPSLEGLGGVANYYLSIYPMLEHPGFSISYLPIGGTQASFGKLSPLMDQLRLLKTLIVLKPDLVHINPSLDFKSFWRDMFFILSAKLIGAKCLVLFHGWDERFEAQVENRFRWLFRRTYGLADYFIVLATQFRKKLEYWGIEAPIAVETTTVPDVLTQHFDPNRKLDSQKSKTSLTIVFLGRLEKEKGVLETLDAVEVLLHRKLEINLIVAGSGSIEKEVLKRIESSDLLRANVEYVGYVRDSAKVAVMERGDVFCFPTSYGEGLPTALLEAMAFGMALITCPVAGIRDIVDDGVNGFFVRQDEIDDIANKIEALYLDKTLLLSIAKNNTQLANERFMASKVSQRILKIYATVLGV